MTENNSDKILLTRIDNRLVHGQVGVTWTNTLGAEVIPLLAVPEAQIDLAVQEVFEAVLTHCFPPAVQ